MSLTAERLREVLSYDPETGEFRWRVSTGRRAKAGQLAGAPHTKGYLQVTIDRRNYLGHRLAWLHTHGQWPARHIDHVNGVASDNRLANLRDASNAQNLANRAGLNSNNTSGYRGVHWCRNEGKWRATVKAAHVGYYDSAAEAAVAYDRAARETFGEFYQPIQAS